MSQGVWRTREPLLLGAIAVVALVAIAVATVQLVHRPAAAPGSLRDLEGNVVVFEPGVVPGARFERRMHAVDQVGAGRLLVPAVGLDVPLGAMDTVDGVVRPPTFTSAYWIRNLGVPTRRAADGTVFVAMHSLRGNGLGPGNFLYDTDSGTARVRRGERVLVDGIGYRIATITTVAQPDLGAQAPLWADRPNRLVLITCLERPDYQPALDNFVVTARRIGA